MKENENYDLWLTPANECHIFTVEASEINLSNYASFRIFDQYESNGVLELDAVTLGRQENIQHVLALYEDDIIRAGRIRDELHIGGQNLESAIAYRNKVIMKDYIQRAGLPCPGYKKVVSALDIVNFVTEHGYPVVVKPQDGMGSQQTYIVRNDAEMVEVVKCGIPSGTMIETFVNGQMFSTNGIAINGKIEFCSANRYSDGGIFFQHQDGFFAEMIGVEEAIYHKILDFTQKVIQSLPTPDRLVFHCELFVTEDDEIIFCEIASRPGGGAICEMIEYSYGIGLFELSAKVLCGLDVSLPGNNPQILSGYYKIPKQQGRLLSKIDSFPFDWVKWYHSRMNEQSTYDSPTSCADVLGTVLFVGQDKGELLERLNVLKNYIATHIKWADEEEV